MFRWLKTFINPDYGIIVSPQSCRVIKKRRAAILLNRIEKKISEQTAQGTREKSLRCLVHVRETLGAFGGKTNKLLKEQAKKAFGA